MVCIRPVCYTASAQAKLHAHIQWQVDRNPKQGPTFDAATVVTATQDAEVHKLVSGELETLKHLVIVILLNGQLG